MILPGRGVHTGTGCSSPQLFSPSHFPSLLACCTKISSYQIGKKIWSLVNCNLADQETPLNALASQYSSLGLTMNGIFLEGPEHLKPILLNSKRDLHWNPQVLEFLKASLYDPELDRCFGCML